MLETDERREEPLRQQQKISGKLSRLDYQKFSKESQEVLSC
jgi:hypothetical protein